MRKFFGGGLQAAILKLFLRHKTRWRRRTQKSDKMKRFLIENWQRKHVVTQKTQREIADLVCVFV
jgi:hypothetical protein